MAPLQIVFAVIVILLMLGLGATMSVDDFRRAFRLWKGPLVACLCQFGLMPLISFCLALALGVSKEAGLSMLVVGCSPGGSTSNLFAYYSRGDLPLSIIATSFSTLLSTGLMPLALLVYSGPFVDESISIPYKSLVPPLGMVLVPVALGMVIKHFSSRLASVVEKVAGIVGMAFILVAMVGGVYVNAHVFTESWKLLVASALLMPIGSGLGYLVAYLAKLPPRACRTLCLETGLQNSTLALAILSFSFEDPEVFRKVSVFPLLYSFFLLIDGALISVLFRYTSRNEEVTQEEKCSEGSVKSAAASAPEMAQSAESLAEEGAVDKVSNAAKEGGIPAQVAERCAAEDGNFTSVVL